MKSFTQVCISKEFSTWALNRTSPVITWLRALARDLHAQAGGPGVGAVGMCFSGGFALAMAVDDEMLAPVLSQPSMPFPLGKARGRARPLRRRSRPREGSRRQREPVRARAALLEGPRGSRRPLGALQAPSSATTSSASRSTRRPATRTASRRRRTRCSPRSSSTSRATPRRTRSTACSRSSATGSRRRADRCASSSTARERSAGSSARASSRAVTTSC